MNIQGKLSKKEFDLMVLLADAGECASQRWFSERTGYALGTINKLLKGLTEKGYYKGNAITYQGLQVLEAYRVKRAVFIAAGFDARLVPVTLNTPKPLIRVNGTRIIDTVLDAIVAAEIPEIVIVRGYLGEQFDQLLYKYPQIRFLENPLFNESNNISSAMCARFLFRNAYVLDADLVLRNPGLIRKYEYESHLLGCPAERTDDWCVTVDKTGYVSSLSRGGTDGFREVGIFYWTEEDGAKLAEDLQQVYCSPGGRERLWEQTPLVYRKEHYRVAIRQCAEEDVVEINNFSELKKMDMSYGL